jgi:phospholipid/cholesterol/gamma-HCH transport system substrate-binding protein
MTVPRRLPRHLTVISVVACTVAGCAFDGVNSLPLPGARGQSGDATRYHVEIANVATLESNSPVMINDVVVGSVGAMTLRGQHADVEIRLQPGAAIAANAVAKVGQTSLLGSMHLALDPPPGQAPAGQIPPGATIPLNRSSTYPSTETTLSSLSAVVSGGGLGQISDIVHNFTAALSGNQDAARDLINRLDSFVGVLNQQRTNMIASMQALNRLAVTLAGRRHIIDDTLRTLPAALDVLIAQKPQIITALNKLRVFAQTATAVVTDTQADLVKNLQNLQPTIRALADVGPGLIDGLMFATVFPYGQNIIDRGLKGDYMNLFAVADLTVPRLKRGMFLGTRWGLDGAELVPAPGDPGYDWYYTKNPLGVITAIAPSGSEVPPPPPPIGPPTILPGIPHTGLGRTPPSSLPTPDPAPLPAEQGGG